MCSILLLSLLAFNQGSAQVQQQQKTNKATHKADSEIRPLPPPSSPPSLPPSASDTGNISVSAPETNSKQQTDKNTTTNDKWDHLATYLSAAATAIIALFTWLTWGVYKEQLRTSKTNERAWIVPVIGEIQPTPDPKTFQIVVDLRNNGKTPAWITAAGSQGKGATKEKPLPDVPPYTDMKPFSEKGSLLVPTGAFSQGFPLTQERINHVLTGQSRLFIFGYVKYRDVYGDSHLTRYCFEAQKSHDANHPHPLEFYVSGPDHYTEAD